MIPIHLQGAGSPPGNAGGYARRPLARDVRPSAPAGPHDGRTDDDVMQQDAVTACFGLADQCDVSLAAERGLDGKAGLCLHERKSACKFVSIQKTHQAQPWQQFACERGLSCAVAATENAEGRGHGANQ